MKIDLLRRGQKEKAGKEIPAVGINGEGKLNFHFEVEPIKTKQELEEVQ